MVMSKSELGVDIMVTTAEAAILRDLLETAHNNLLLELSRADSLEYKNTLRPREAVLAKVLDQLKSSQ